MTKKYTKWLDGKEFKHNKLLKRRYENIDVVPVYTPTARFNYIKYTISKPGHFNGELTDIQERIMGLVSTHSFVSVKQIKTYLELQGLDISFSEIGKTLEDLIFYNLIERNTITRRETAYDQNVNMYVNSDCESVKLYSQGCYRPFSNRMFPTRSVKNLAIIKQDCGNAMPTLALSMHIVNQILLNSMIYAGNVKRFRIAQIKYLPNMRIVVPLEIATNNHTYYFINAVFLTTYRLQEILRNWAGFSMMTAENSGKDNMRDSSDKKAGNHESRRNAPFTVVIIAANTEHLVRIMDVVNNEDTCNYNVAFTIYDEWFQKKGGTFFQKEMVK